MVAQGVVGMGKKGRAARLLDAPAAVRDRELAAALPDPARAVLASLEAVGHEAWVVGGWVRDALLGSPAHDVDVCTSALWQESERALAAAGIPVHETGTRHGTVTAVVGGAPVEVTTYRVDGTYSDLRHPDSVRFVRDVREDLARRDLTVNAMAFHPERGLLDPFGGRDDLRQGVVRAVGVPEERFAEDALRVLRAVRFAARLGFSVEPATQRALVAAAPGLARVARERVGAELTGILATGRAGWALREETAAMVAALPELAPCAGFDQRSPYHCYDVLGHTSHVLDGMEALGGGVVPAYARWAALFHDVAKPRCLSVGEDGRGHFPGHAKEGARMARRAMGRMAIPHEVIGPCCALVALHETRPDTPRGVRRTLRALGEACPGEPVRPLAHELLLLRRADALAKAPDHRQDVTSLGRVERMVGEELERGCALRVRDLAVGGEDVMEALGVGPGPAVGEALSWLLAQVVDEGVPNTREALLAALSRRR